MHRWERSTWGRCMAMTHERLAVSSGLHTILTNYRFSGSPNLQNPQPTTSLLEFKINNCRMLVFLWLTCLLKMGHFKRNVLQPSFFSGSARGSISFCSEGVLQQFDKTSSWINDVRQKTSNKWGTLPQTNINIFRHWKPWWQRETLTFPFGK